ncbi:MAG: PP2C family protein-serine/threonine phosphatase [Eubacterium sp.]|nr:PP2C family protein-serine/threonine phosphatase [Eubacterium sp.]
MDKLKKVRTSMAFSFISAIVLSLVIFGAIVSGLGSLSFTNAFKKEYSTSTYHMADTATALVNGDLLDAYLAGDERVQYLETKRGLDDYCKRMNVTMIYIIKVDRSDYGRFVSIFNPINNEVDDSEYVEWELGHKRDTTNDEYRRKYRNIYEQKSLYETVYRNRPTDGQHPHITTMVPVKNSAGDVAAILCMQRPISEIREGIEPYLITVAVSAFILSLVAAMVVTSFIRKNFVEPVGKVSAEAARFARSNTKGEPLETISRFTEIKNLVDAIETMESDMVTYMENLTAVTAEKERIGAELSLAGKIQENAVPNDFPAIPEKNEFDIYASMTPAKEVGGDFYNFFMIDDDHLALVIGDVSDKGVPAALFMMETNIVLSDKTRLGGTPAEILAYVNDSICAHNEAEMFVTLWLGILELSTGRLTASIAGHDDAIVYKKGGNFADMKTKHGLVAGAMPGITYRDFEIMLGKGDKIFIYTDGLSEARAEDNRMYGIKKIVETLNTCKDGSPREILECITESVNAFTCDMPQFDDLTMLCMEYLGPEAEDSIDKRE